MDSLFDFDDELAPKQAEQEQPQDSQWEEVPQARFLFWSAAMQYRYCAERDRDSAEFAETYAEAMWYLERAKSYDELAERTK